MKGRAGSDLDIGEDLLEGEGHASADDDAVDTRQEVLDEQDLVADLGTARRPSDQATRVRPSDPPRRRGAGARACMRHAYPPRMAKKGASGLSRALPK